MARQQPDHRYDCPCNACVRRRNARRRRDADRYAEEGRPLPQGSQTYEIPRDLPPVYSSGPLEVRDIVDAGQSKTSRPIPPTGTDGFSILNPKFPAPTTTAVPGGRRGTHQAGGFAPASTQPSEGWTWKIVVKAIVMLLVLAAFGGGIVYGAVRLGWLETDETPAVSLPALLPTETPQPSELPPTETPNAATPTPTMIPTPTLSPTSTPSPTPTPVATPTTTVAVAVPTEQEIVISAFAECDGQYSGVDRQARARAANQTIKVGYQTVASIRELVNERCGGVFPLLAASNTERPTVAKPTITRPMATPELTPTPTLMPTLRPTPTTIVSTASRFNSAEMETAIYERINAYRQQQGQAKLKWDDQLARIARAHSEDMAKNDRYSHVNLAGDDASARARKSGYNCDNPLSIGVAENIHLLYGHTTMLYGRPYTWETQERMIQRFVADWTSSPGHRRNILDPRYGKTGIGVAFGTAMGIEGGIYVTQKFC